MLAAARAMVEAGFGIKAATITPEGKDDVGSPNTLISGTRRREGDCSHRPANTGRAADRPGVHYPISVVRMAVGDAYGAEEHREPQDGDELAFRTERLERSDCRAVSEYSFRTASAMHARVYGGPKWTVSPLYEGMLKEELDAAAERHPDVPYQPAADRRHLRGPVAGAADSPLVVPALNRDGDSLSELVLSLLWVTFSTRAFWQ